MEVAAETEKLEKRSEGLGGEVKKEKSIDLTAGIPKPVKKTFAEQVSYEGNGQAPQGESRLPV